MEGDIKGCKKGLIEAASTFNLDEGIRVPLMALAKNIFIINGLITEDHYRKTITGRIKELISEVVKGGFSARKMLRELEDRVIIEAFLSKFDLLERDLERFVNGMSLELSTKGILGKLQSAFEFAVSKEAIGANVTFEVFWNTQVEGLVADLFGANGNRFMKRMLFRHFFPDVPKLNYKLPLDHDLHKRVAKFLLGSKDHFKFLFNATGAYKHYLNHSAKKNESLNIFNPENSQLKFRFSNSRNKDFLSVIQDKKILINKQYLIEKENFFTIGKYHLADIQLPAEDKEASNITACIFFKENDFFIMDTSHKRFYVSRKLAEQKEYKVHEDMVIDLATRHLISIKSVKKIQKEKIQKEQSSYSCLEWEFIRGDYSNPLGESRINTLNSDESLSKNKALCNDKQKVFIFGRHGSEETCFRFSDQRISKKHLYFKYNLETSKWTIYEWALTKHGSYIMFKDKNEIMNKIISTPKRLFYDDTFEILFIEGYYVCIQIEN